MNEDERWMQIAIKEAYKASSENEVPVGAIIIKNGLIIAKGHNQPILKSDPTAHAEIQVIRKASKKLKNYRLTESTLYVTLEPCAMCFGAIMQARIKRVVFGAYDPKTGVCGSCEDLQDAIFFHHKVKITGGVFEKKSQAVLQEFFQKKRKEK
tara:strand:- start:105 stop:563 length:459 start_codon:yes stop_codon:yes gene_type:complete